MGSLPPEDGSYSFTSPPQPARFHGFLFDNDGTLIDSTAAIVKHWHRIGEELGLDPEEVLKTSHGRRSVDTLKLLVPEKATWEYVCHVEGMIPKLYGQSAVELPGSRKLLDDLSALHVPWTIVTSATVPLVTGWLEIMKLSQPPALVTAEDVQNGKPDPECYALGQKKLGLEGEDKQVLVIEDAPPGVVAGKAAGCKVVAVHTTYPIDQLIAAGADWIVRDLRSIQVKGIDKDTKLVEIEILDALQIPN
ncbi:MAG: hypothetical protein M1834_001782 [Cirrosporium novae-zelandiae]|nr:MAG: hypothetical protein M1834_001782 [Cirrosporium novae-zelandiae]